uniref:RING-type E3 ubiquitin transferase n=1 Tax=Xenopsylla cheopis TaxID=163159 RepID=A0A6M2DSL5_XENCH
MAEAAVEEIPSPPTRYYCHGCSIEFDQIAPGYTCPNCDGGFVEELAPAVETNTEENVEDLDEDPMLLNHHMGDLASLLFSGDHSHISFRTDGDSGQGASGRQRRRMHRNQHFPFGNLLQDIIINSTSGHWTGQTVSADGHPSGPMMFLGNLGDYAWGREGFDLIVTQLLNQIESIGPPPLESEQISSLPTVKITAEQTSIKLQCSVCWEDFKEDEMVRQLPCSHVYHDQCIFPWLQLHATCPICRKSLSTREDSVRENRIAGILQHIGSNNTRSGESNATATVTTASNLPSSTETQNNTGGSRRNQDEPMRDYNMDLEFD